MSLTWSIFKTYLTLSLKTLQLALCSLCIFTFLTLSVQAQELDEGLVIYPLPSFQIYCEDFPQDIMCTLVNSYCERRTVSSFCESPVDYCFLYPFMDDCFSNDFCEAYPTSLRCLKSSFCEEHLSSELCFKTSVDNNICEQYSGHPQCTSSSFCSRYPDSSQCQFAISFCLDNPEHSQCRASNYCLDFPLDSQCIGLHVSPINICDIHPLAPGCPTDICLTQPSYPGCGGDICATEPSYPGCRTICDREPLAPGCGGELEIFDSKIEQISKTFPQTSSLTCELLPSLPECNQDDHNLTPLRLIYNNLCQKIYPSSIYSISRNKCLVVLRIQEYCRLQKDDERCDQILDYCLSNPQKTICTSKVERCLLFPEDDACNLSYETVEDGLNINNRLNLRRNLILVAVLLLILSFLSILGNKFRAINSNSK